MSDVRCQSPLVGLRQRLLTDIWHLTSDIYYRLFTDIWHLTSDIYYRLFTDI
jgi:hypothetical protein